MAIEIQEVLAADAPHYLDGLCRVLKDVVESGGAVGFLPPLSAIACREYWQSVMAAIAAGGRVLLVAEENGMVLGTVQLALAPQSNGLHRAEVMKLIVHREARRRGVGRSLLEAIEAAARRHGRSLLVLDTRAGDDGERLYRRLGYTAAGRIPRYARSADGSLHDTVVYFKEIDGHPDSV